MPAAIPAGGANTARDSGAGAAENAASRPSGECTFWLIAHGGTPIFWGYAPGANVAGELQAADKIGRLKRYFAEHDSLDSSDRQPLYIRTMQPGVAR